MTLGHDVYTDMYHGIPKENFPEKIAMLSKECVDVGGINHSKNFPSQFHKTLQVVMKNSEFSIKSPATDWTVTSSESGHRQGTTQALEQKS